MPFVLSFHIGKFGVALTAVFALVALVVGAGLTNSYGSGLRLETNTGWVSDGAPRDTVWNSHFVDIPGASVVGLHCHGRVQLSLQAGATGWPHNPCYEAMGLSSDSRGSSEVKFILPGGRKLCTNQMRRAIRPAGASATSFMWTRPKRSFRRRIPARAELPDDMLRCADNSGDALIAGIALNPGLRRASQPTDFTAPAGARI